MNIKQASTNELVVKEYPRYTRWFDGQLEIGVGNLLLTSERLIFLHLVHVTDEKKETLQKLAENATTTEMLNQAIALHKKNFQFPLSAITSVKTSLHSILPFPRFCLRISHQSEKKKHAEKTLTFMFTIPLWKGWFQLEITTVMLWVRLIKAARRAASRRSKAKVTGSK